VPEPDGGAEPGSRVSSRAIEWRCKVFTAPAKALRADRRGDTPVGVLTESFLSSDERPSSKRAADAVLASALGKAAEMATKPTLEPTESPVPGVIPEPSRVQDDSAPAKARATTEAVPSRPGLAGRLLGVLRGDKYMADAYPPPKER
jgi:hypothetical protein